MKWCIISLSTLLFAYGCEKPDSERSLRSVQSHNYITEAYDKIPPHNIVMTNLIPKMIKDNWQYDSLYVTSSPRRSENESGYSVVPLDGEKLILIYHFWSVKKIASTQTFIIYDPQGDEYTRYMGQIYE